MSDLFLGTGGARFSGNRARSFDGTSKGGIRYPSPFFDIGHTYLPPTMKALLRWCRYYYLCNPLINAVISKMSEYPITELVVDERDPEIKEKWEDLLGNHLGYRAFQVEVGLDYYTYGMCIVTIHYPFTKYLICQHCKFKEKAAKSNYRLRNFDYVLTCKKCGQQGPAKIQDFYERDVRRIRLQRWNPENVSVDQAFGGADPTYTFEIPLQLKNEILIGKKTVLDTIPDVFIEALKRNKHVAFSRDNVFVFKRPIISQKDNGWGMPLILPVLKDTFYLQILRKAQEAIAQEHIVPLRVLFPQAGSSSSDPYTTIPLENWRSRIESEIAKWKYDNNYIPILPLPIGNETIGGDGRALMLHQEMQAWSDQIVAGMGVPREFVFGGLSYSGSNVSMRILENTFIGYRTDHHKMLNQFTIRRIAHFMGWPTVKAHMRRFKMADDLQRSAFFFQLNQAQKLSDQTLLQECDQDPVVEDELKKIELGKTLEYTKKMQIAQANIAGEVMVVQAKYQGQAQQVMQANMPAPIDPNTGMPADPAAGAPEGGGMPGMPGEEGGQEGEMVTADQIDPSLPGDVTISPNDGKEVPTEGVPQQMASPLTQGTIGGGYNLLHLAKRIATSVEKKPELEKNTELNKIRLAQPQLYMLVMRLLQSRQGSQANPLDPLQSPLPEQKPSRRDAPVGA